MSTKSFLITAKLTKEEQKVLQQYRAKKAKEDKIKQEEEMAKVPRKIGTLREDLYYDNYNTDSYMSGSERAQEIRIIMAEFDERIKRAIDDIYLIGKAGDKFVATGSGKNEIWMQETTPKDFYDAFNENSTWAKKYLIDIQDIKINPLPVKQKKGK